MKIKVLLTAIVCVTFVSLGQTAAAQQSGAPSFDRLPLFGRPDASSLDPLSVEELPTPASAKADTADRRLTDPRVTARRASAVSGPTADVRGSGRERETRAAMTPAEMRQARAIYSMRHRMARLERDAWQGRIPLRPSFHRIPGSGLNLRPTVTIPVYIYQ